MDGHCDLPSSDNKWLVCFCFLLILCKILQKTFKNVQKVQQVIEVMAAAKTLYISIFAFCL